MGAEVRGAQVSHPGQPLEEDRGETVGDMAVYLAHGPARVMSVIKKLISETWLMALPATLAAELRARRD